MDVNVEIFELRYFTKIYMTDKKRLECTAISKTKVTQLRLMINLSRTWRGGAWKKQQWVTHFSPTEMAWPLCKLLEEER